MKKIMAIVLVIGIALCLTGCEKPEEKRNASADDGFKEIVIIDCWGNPV